MNTLRPMVAVAWLLFLGGLAWTSPLKEVVENSIKTLKSDKDSKTRLLATEELAKAARIKASYVAPAVPVLMEAVKGDSDPMVRSAAIGVLGLVEPDAKTVMPILIAALDDKQDRAVRVAAATILRSYGIGAREAMPILAAIKKKEEAKDEGQRDQELLGNVNDSLQAIQEAFANEVQRHVEALKTDKDAKKRIEAAKELVRISELKPPPGLPVVQSLVEALVRDKDIEVFQFLSQWLRTSKPDPKVVVPVLIAALSENEDRAVRIAAASIVGTLRGAGKDAVQVLTEIQNKEKEKEENQRDKELLNRVIAALEKLQAASSGQ